MVWKQYVSFGKRLPSQDPCVFAFLVAVNEHSSCSMFLPTFGIVSVPDFRHHNRRAPVPCFDLHVSGDICGDPFHALIFHLHILFGAVPVKV